MRIDVSESAVANSYLDADGFVNGAKLQALTKKVMAAAEKLGLKANGVFYTKKEVIKQSATLEKTKDTVKRHKYQVLRAQPIRGRKTMPKAGPSALTGKLLFVAYEGLDRTLQAEVKKAMSAIAKHNTKSVKVVGNVKEEKADIREEKMAAFDKNLVVLKEILLAGGIKESSIVEGRSMFGKTVYVQLPNKGVITIGASDAASMLKAKRAATAE